MPDLFNTDVTPSTGPNWLYQASNWSSFMSMGTPLTVILVFRVPIYSVCEDTSGQIFCCFLLAQQDVSHSVTSPAEYPNRNIEAIQGFFHATPANLAQLSGIN